MKSKIANRTLQVAALAALPSASGHLFAPPLMFVAGDDQQREPVVLKLVQELGFEVVDAGPLRIARFLEPYAMLWIDQVLTRGAGRNFANARVRRRDT